MNSRRSGLARGSLAGWCLAVVLPAALHAQTIPSQPISQDECQAAAAALASGARDGQGWGRLPECGTTGGTALGSALRGARNESDSVYLQNLLTAAARIRDPNVLAAGLDVSGDKTASVPARVVALLVLLSQYDNSVALPVSLSWNDLVRVPRGASCRFSAVLEGGYASELTMPSDYLQQIAQRMDGIAADDADSPIVRDLARCIRVALSTDVPETVAPALIKLTYICGDKFRVRNGGGKWVDVTYDVYKTTDTGDLTVPPNGEIFFTTEVTGTTRLFYQGTLVQTKANGGATCSP